MIKNLRWAVAMHWAIKARNHEICEMMSVKFLKNEKRGMNHDCEDRSEQKEIMGKSRPSLRARGGT
jgi:hypothetical protein